VSYMKDSAASRLDSFDPRRDVRGLLGWWDASTLTGTNGSPVLTWPDSSGLRNDAAASSAATAPTLNATGHNGHPTLAFTSTQMLTAQSFANRWDLPAVAQPVTMFAVVKASSTGPTNAARAIAASATSGGQAGLYIGSAQSLAISGANGSYGSSHGGRTLNDDTWHVVTGRLGANVGTNGFGETLVDGYMTAVAVTSDHGTNPIGAQLNIGAVGGSYFPLVGEIAEILIYSGAINDREIDRVNAYLSTKWGTPATPQHHGVVSQDITDANGQAIRLFYAPAKRAASMPLVIDNHQQSGTDAIVPGYYAYPMIYELANAGFVVAVPTNHGTDSWSNDSACGDQTAARTAAATTLGITVSATVLVGQSMGGCLSVIAAKETRLPDLKGVYLVDAAVNLQWMYANGYSSSINTGFGITSASSIPVGKDPCTLTSSALPQGIRWRATASTADTTVSKTNNIDLLAPIIAGAAPLEWTELSHPGVHLATEAFLPDDIVAFAKRCVGA